MYRITDIIGYMKTKKKHTPQPPKEEYDTIKVLQKWNDVRWLYNLGELSEKSMVRFSMFYEMSLLQYKRIAIRWTWKLIREWRKTKSKIKMRNLEIGTQLSLTLKGYRYSCRKITITMQWRNFSLTYTRAWNNISTNIINETTKKILAWHICETKNWKIIKGAACNSYFHKSQALGKRAVQLKHKTYDKEEYSQLRKFHGIYSSLWTRYQHTHMKH